MSILAIVLTVLAVLAAFVAGFSVWLKRHIVRSLSAAPMAGHYFSDPRSL